MWLLSNFMVVLNISYVGLVCFLHSLHLGMHFVVFKVYCLLVHYVCNICYSLVKLVDNMHLGILGFLLSYQALECENICVCLMVPWLIWN